MERPLGQMKQFLGGKRHSRGFTIVELLIVIVVIGILAALVLTSFAGAQAKARDAQRVTDVKAVSTQLEAYFNSSVPSAYPDVNTTPTATTFGLPFITANLKGIDTNALIEPGSATSYDFVNATALTAALSGTIAPPTASTPASSIANNKFIYVPYNGGGTSAVLCVVSGCQHFAIFYYTEVSPSPAVQIKTSLN